MTALVNINGGGQIRIPASVNINGGGDRYLPAAGNRGLYKATIPFRIG
jgi:hypothetical protein